MGRVCIIQPVIKQYRVPFYLQLHSLLEQRGILLEVVYGAPWPGEDKRRDHATLPNPLGRSVASRMLFGKLFFMATFRPWWNADLVVVEHAGKHALNYVLEVMRVLGLVRLAYWGHGRDLKAAPNSWIERYKRRSLHRADWWFAYTRSATDYLIAQGYPGARITTVQNAIDTRGLRVSIQAVGVARKSALLRSLGWDGKAVVGIFCGSFYPDKRLDWLIEASRRVVDKHPNFRLLILGDGDPDLVAKVSAFARSNPWVHAPGACFSDSKAEFLSLAHVWLNPGLVGLGILDAFSAGLPVIACNVVGHGPEIDYLEHDDNGWMIEPGSEALAEAIGVLIDAPETLDRLRHGALRASERYSVETMAMHFAEGIEQALIDRRC